MYPEPKKFSETNANTQTFFSCRGSRSKRPAQPLAGNLGSFVRSILQSGWCQRNQSPVASALQKVYLGRLLGAEKVEESYKD